MAADTADASRTNGTVEERPTATEVPESVKALAAKLGNVEPFDNLMARMHEPPMNEMLHEMAIGYAALAARIDLLLARVAAHEKPELVKRIGSQHDAGNS